MDDSIVFTREIVAQLIRGLKEIRKEQGYGVLSIVIKKGQPEYVNYQVDKRFKLPENNDKE